MNLIQSLRNLLFPYGNCESAARQLCELLKVPATKSKLQQLLYEHPDYPSLLSISDILKGYNVDNMAIKTKLENFRELPFPVISQITLVNNQHRDTYLVVVTAYSESSTTFFHPLEQKEVTMANKEFKEIFLGYTLVAEANETSKEKDYNKNLKEEKTILFTKIFSLLALPVLTIFLCCMAMFQDMSLALAPVMFVLLCLSGSFIGALLLWYEIDKHNPVMQQICSSGKKTNCNAILHSSVAKIFGISWSVIGFSYFSGSLFALLITGVTNPSTLLLLSWLNVSALPYILFSVYYQSKIAKQWCLMCLAVQVLLALLFVTALAGNLHSIELFANVTAYHVVSLLVAFVVPFLAATLLVPAFQKAKENKQNKSELLRLKHNEQIFSALLAKQKVITEPIGNLGIQLGNPNAKYKLVKVCNPYCDPCAKAHPAIEDLLENNPDVQVQIIFTATAEGNDYRALPVSHLMAVAEKNDEQLSKKALDDWYLPSEKDYEAFARKHPLKTELSQQNDKLKEMSAWCKKNEIAYTPTFFVNGSQLPEQYSVADLKYFFSV